MNERPKDVPPHVTINGLGYPFHRMAANGSAIFRRRDDRGFYHDVKVPFHKRPPK